MDELQLDIDNVPHIRYDCGCTYWWLGYGEMTSELCDKHTNELNKFDETTG